MRKIVAILAAVVMSVGSWVGAGVMTENFNGETVDSTLSASWTGGDKFTVISETTGNNAVRHTGTLVNVATKKYGNVLAANDNSSVITFYASLKAAVNHNNSPVMLVGIEGNNAAGTTHGFGPQFGFYGTKFRIQQRANGGAGTYDSTSTFTVAYNTWYDLKLVVDPTANSGSGSAALWWKTADTDWAQVTFSTGTQVPLLLDTVYGTGGGRSPYGVSGFDTWRLQAGEFNQVTFDNLDAVVPEPASLSVLALGAMGLMARRRRQAA